MDAHSSLSVCTDIGGVGPATSLLECSQIAGVICCKSREFNIEIVRNVGLICLNHIKV